MKIDSAYFITKYSKHTVTAGNEPDKTSEDLRNRLREKLAEIETNGKKAGEVEPGNLSEIDRIRRLLAARDEAKSASPEGLGKRIDILA